MSKILSGIIYIALGIGGMYGGMYWVTHSIMSWYSLPTVLIILAGIMIAFIVGTKHIEEGTRTK